MKKDELKLLKMSDIQVREVDWLWYPYIPFGKLTIIHGDPGEGKTTFALRLAAACSTGTPLPNMDTIAPITVIYQSAEDGLDDKHGIYHKGRIRKLMPIECWRLQGFSDEQFYKAQATGLKDGHLYKMAGNAVSVPVISAIGQRLYEINHEFEIVKE